MLIKLSNIYRHVLIVLFALMTTMSSRAQINVQQTAPYDNAVALVDILLGAGVQATNQQLTGNGIEQFGYFWGAAPSVGLDSGLVMSSGHVISLTGANTQDGISGMATNGVTVSDPDLVQILNSGQGTPQWTGDLAVLEFDFVPEGDTVKFQYVFGSDEYNEWVCSQYNDVFGFFLSGPGIAGTYTNNAVNLALLPGGGPVAINTVNNGQVGNSGMLATCQGWGNWNGNTGLFVDNGWDPNTFTYTGSVNIECDGLTVVMTAVYPVTCGETYHIKLAIADGSEDGGFGGPPDTSLDSWVFLEAGSFSSNHVEINPTTSYPAIGGDSVLYEGCGNMDLLFERFGDLSVEDTVVINIFGDATNGFDYTTIPDTIFFLADSNEAAVNIEALSDALTEDVESLTLQIVNDGCSVTDTFELTVFIGDPLNISLTSVDDTLDCTGPFQPLVTSVTGGIPGYTYLWSTGETTDTAWVHPSVSTNFFVTVSDSCGTSTMWDTINVHVPSNPVSVLALDTTLGCTMDTIDLVATYQDGIGTVDVWWSNGAVGDTIEDVIITGETTLTVYATDDCAIVTATDQMTVFVPNIPPIVPELSSLTDSIDCPEEPKVIAVKASGGVGGYIYTWDDWVTQADSIIVETDTIILLPVQITDACRADTAIAVVTVYAPNYDPLVYTAVIDTFICPGDQTDITVNVTGGAAHSGYTYEWSHFGGDTNAINVNPVETTTYYLDVNDNCNEIYSDSMTINVVVPKADFNWTYQGDLSIIFENTSSEDAIYYWWDFNNGDDSREKDLIYHYPDDGDHFVTLLVRNEHGCEDEIYKEVEPPLAVYLPGAFTPDEDGLNDVYQAKGVGMRRFQLWIFNRFGELVYESEDPDESWDGANAPQGVYVYKVLVEGHNLEKYEKMGTITLIK